VACANLENVELTKQTGKSMPRKIRDLLAALRDAGFEEIRGAGKGSHRKLVHPKYAGAVTVSGKTGDDAKRYQEKQVAQAIEMVSKWKISTNTTNGWSGVMRIKCTLESALIWLPAYMVTIPLLSMVSFATSCRM
jgi:predicted RNA binding protein YcfA (HicA-like mRNA interferase family)